MAPPAGFASDPALITFGDQEVTDDSGPSSGNGIAGLASAQSTWQATILPASSTFLNTIATAWNAYLASDAVAWSALQLTAAGIPPDQQSNFEAAWNQFKSDLAASANAFNAQAATALYVFQAGQPAGLASLIPSIPFAPLSTFSTLGTQAAAQGYVPSHLPTGISDNTNPTFQYYYGQSGLLINAVFPNFGITLAAPALPTAPNSPPFLNPVGPPVNNAVPLQFQGLGSPAVGLNIGQPTDTFGQTTGFYSSSTGLQIHNTINFSDPAQPSAANPTTITTTFNLPSGATTPTVAVASQSSGIGFAAQTGPGSATAAAVTYTTNNFTVSIAAQNNIGIFSSASIQTSFGYLSIMVPISDPQHHHPTIHFHFNLSDLFFNPIRR